MSTTQEGASAAICSASGNDRSRVLDIVLAVQKEFGCVNAAAIDQIAEALSVSRLEVESVVSFYSFLSTEKKGQITIRLCNDIIDEMKGAGEVAQGLEEELGIEFGQTTADGRFTLEYTSCIGMSDQAPAALVNDLVIPRLGPGKAIRGVRILKESEDLRDPSAILIRDYGDGNNSHDLVRAAVRNNIRAPGPAQASARHWP